MKSNLLKKASILMIGVIISRLIGLFVVFPFAKMVKNEGVILFSYAYVPYSLFLDLSTLGIPNAIAKVISKNNSSDKNCFNKSFFLKSIIISFAFGIFCFLILNLFSKKYAMIILANKNNYNNINEVINIIRLVSISLVFLPVLACFKGYFQGNMNYYIYSFLQILEQAIRACIILFGSYYILNYTNLGYVYACYIAVLSSAIAVILTNIISLFFLKFPKEFKKITFKEVIKIFKASVIPYSIYGLFFSLYPVIDSIFFNKNLIKAGINNPEYYYGIYQFEVQKIIIIPVSLFLCVGQSLMVKITKYLKFEKYKRINLNIKKSIDYCITFLLPISLMLVIFKDFFYYSFFDNNGGENILSYYAILVFVFGLNGLLSSIMQGLDNEKKLKRNLIIGLIVKFFITPIFIKKFLVNGAIFSTILGNMIVIVLNIYNIFSIHKIKIKNIKINLYKKTIFIFIFFIVILLLNYYIDFNIYAILITILSYILIIILMNHKKNKTYNNIG